MINPNKFLKELTHAQRLELWHTGTEYAVNHNYVLAWPSLDDLVDAFIAGAQAMKEINDEC